MTNQTVFKRPRRRGLLGSHTNHTNQRAIVPVIVMTVLLSILSGYAMPTPDEESYSREFAKELTGWLAALDSPPLSSSNTVGVNPCQHYNNLFGPPPLPQTLTIAAPPPQPPSYFVPFDKRNSELINSLLTLPKQLNEVGK